MSAPFDDPEAARSDLPADVMAFVAVVEALAIPEIIGQGDGASTAAEQLVTLCRIVREQASELSNMRAKRQEVIDGMTRAISDTGDANNAYYAVCSERDALRERLAKLEVAARAAGESLQGCTLSHPDGITVALLRLEELRELVT